LFVYIREAHPSDSNWADDEKLIEEPLTLTQRGTVASQCSRELSLTMPMVVDDMHDTVNQLYGAWPERIYVIDTDGNIAFKGGLGPFGFKPKKAEHALRALLDSE